MFFFTTTQARRISGERSIEHVLMRVSPWQVPLPTDSKVRPPKSTLKPDRSAAVDVGKQLEAVKAHIEDLEVGAKEGKLREAARTHSLLLLHSFAPGCDCASTPV